MFLMMLIKVFDFDEFGFYWYEDIIFEIYIDLFDIIYEGLDDEYYILLEVCWWVCVFVGYCYL